MLTLLHALLRLATLRWLGVFVCALAVLLSATSTASALEPAQTKTRVWGFDSAERNSVGLFRAASPRTYLENRSGSAEEASGSLLAAGALPAVSRTARLTQEGVEHIPLRHFPTSGATGAGKFATTSLREVRSLINETVARGTIRPNTLGRPGSIFELNFGRQVGTNVAGEAATSLRVVVTPEGVVKTAFPF